LVQVLQSGGCIASDGCTESACILLKNLVRNHKQNRIDAISSGASEALSHLVQTGSKQNNRARHAAIEAAFGELKNALVIPARRNQPAINSDGRPAWDAKKEQKATFAEYAATASVAPGKRKPGTKAGQLASPRQEKAPSKPRLKTQNRTLGESSPAKPRPPGMHRAQATKLQPLHRERPSSSAATRIWARTSSPSVGRGIEKSDALNASLRGFTTERAPAPSLWRQKSVGF
jgi:hypothetical protein